MNLYIGHKISIISDKPQTTRNKISGMLTSDDYQVIFIDTPGIHKPTSKLGQYMVKTAQNAMNEVDCVVYMVEPRPRANADTRIINRLGNIGTPVFLVINKADTVPKQELLPVIADYQKMYNFSEVFLTSALKAEGTMELLDAIKNVLPEGPKYFPDDEITDQPERQIVSELIREKVLLFMREEVPHGVAVAIDQMTAREGQDLVDVYATIYADKDSHKGMLIGKDGAMLKRIGQTARVDIEHLLGSPVNLQLWVKVKKEWRNSDFYIRNFGFTDS
jgi:GTP-binding protein Era